MRRTSPPAGARLGWEAPTRAGSRDLDLALHALLRVTGDRALVLVSALLEGHRAGVGLPGVRLQIEVGVLDLEGVLERTLVGERDLERTRGRLDRPDVEVDIERVDGDLAVGDGLGRLAAALAAAAGPERKHCADRDEQTHEAAGGHRVEASHDPAAGAGSGRGHRYPGNACRSTRTTRSNARSA